MSEVQYRINVGSDVIDLEKSYLQFRVDTTLITGDEQQIKVDNKLIIF